MGRPSKHDKTPAPYYLTDPSVAYCHFCGRHIGSTKISHTTNIKEPNKPEIKFCSSRCRSNKKSRSDLDQRTDAALLDLLTGRREVNASEPRHSAKKGDPRIVVRISDIELLVFGERIPSSVVTTTTMTAAAVGADLGVDRSDDGDDELANGELSRDERVDLNADAQRLGQEKAEQRERAKCAARRAVVFGLEAPASAAGEGSSSLLSTTMSVRKCEALVQGVVVEPSFAKGDWAIRWRDI